MVGVVKSCLLKVIGKRTLDVYEMMAVLSDVENAINDRPLTYRCTDNSGFEVISPNHFVKPFVSNNILFNDGVNPLKSKGAAREEIVKILNMSDEMLGNFTKLCVMRSTLYH